MSSPASHERLPRAVLLAYGAGEMTVTISMVLFGLFILFFYTAVMKLPATLAGIGSAVGLLWDAVIDPYIGHRSDNQRGRFGRRHGYMLAGAVFTGAAFCLLLSPPRGLGTPALFAWLLGATLLFRFAGAVFRIPYLSLGADLSRDYHERTAVAGVRSFFGLCGTLAAATLSFALFFPNRLPGVDPKLEYAGYPRMGLAFGLAMTVAGILSVAGTFSRRHAPGRPAAVAPRFWPGFASAWRNRAFRSVWLAFTLFFFAVVLNAALAIHYFTWYVRIVDSEMLGRLQLCFYVGALAGVGPWVRMARRFEKRPLCVAALVATGSLMFLAYAFFGHGSLFGTGHALPLALGNLLAGGFAGALWVLPGSMLADVADADELGTGRRREGLFFGLLNLGEKIAAGAALLAAGVLLDTLVGFVPGVAPTAAAVSRIGLLYAAVPAAILAVAAISAAGYGLDRRAVLEIQAQLHRRGAPAPADAGGGRRGIVAERVAV